VLSVAGAPVNRTHFPGPVRRLRVVPLRVAAEGNRGLSAVLSIAIPGLASPPVDREVSGVRYAGIPVPIWVRAARSERLRRHDEIGCPVGRRPLGLSGPVGAMATAMPSGRRQARAHLERPQCRQARPDASPFRLLAVPRRRTASLYSRQSPSSPQEVQQDPSVSGLHHHECAAQKEHPPGATDAQSRGGSSRCTTASEPCSAHTCGRIAILIIVLATGGNAR
jgi:hypothetical protein